MREFKVIGHRGACAHEPENTLGSLRRAIADGADMVEIDIQMADGELLVIHDDSVDRTTDGSGTLAELGFVGVRLLDAGKGERVPTLAEVLATVRDRIELNIEIKDSAATPGVCELLSASGFDLSQVVLSSFDHDATAEARELLADLPIGVLGRKEAESIEEMFAHAEKLGAFSVHPSIRGTDRELVERAHDRGFKVLPYTVRNLEQAELAMEIGADGAFADDPAWLRSLAGK